MGHILKFLRKGSVYNLVCKVIDNTRSTRSTTIIRSEKVPRKVRFEKYLLLDLNENKVLQV